jgi:hypothetical protein
LVILPSPFKLPNFKGVSFINVHLWVFGADCNSPG